MTNLDDMIRTRAYELGDQDNFRRDPAAYWLEAESEIKSKMAPLEIECCTKAAPKSAQAAAGIAAPDFSGHPARSPSFSKRLSLSFWPSLRSVVRELMHESDLVRATTFAYRPRR